LPGLASAEHTSSSLRASWPYQCGVNLWLAAVRDADEQQGAPVDVTPPGTPSSVSTPT